MYGIINQRINSWWQYKRKYLRVNPGKNNIVAIFNAIISLRTIPQGRSKVTQLSKLFNKSKISNRGYGNFFYSLDERCVPLLAGKVIDNMPVDYSRILDYSLEDLKIFNQEVNNKIAKQNIEMISVIENYLNYILPKIENQTTRDYLSGLVTRRAESLEEALQRILFINQLLWQSKHTLMGFGRIDKILSRFEISGESKEIINNFLRTLHEFFNFKSNSLLGDTGQIFILGGLEQDGSYFRNEYTYLFIECIKELGLPDPKALLRVSKNMPDKLVKSAALCIATGGGSPLLSNDDVVISALIDFGYTEEDAYKYGTSACWEPLIIGKSLEQNNIASIVYGQALHDACVDDKFTNCMSFEDVLDLFYSYLAKEVKTAEETVDKIDWEYDPLVTLFTEECIDKDLDISCGGASYNDYGLLTEGMSSAVNSLLNIRHFCFEEQRVSLETIKECIKHSYDGYETEKILFSANDNGFGTDSEEAIVLTNEIIECTSRFVENYRNRFGGKVKFGLSSPNYVKSGLKVGATVDGRLANTPFATHISREGGEAIIEIANFASKLHYEGYNANANVVDVIIQPNLIMDNIDKFILYLKAIIRMGVFQIQFNVLSYEKLIDAKAHPEKYPSLIVRVWGFNAYFKDLPENYQEQLIKRAKDMERV